MRVVSFTVNVTRLIFMWDTIVKAFTFTWRSTKQHRDLDASRKKKSSILALARLFSFCGSGKVYCLYDSEEKYAARATKGAVKVWAWKKWISVEKELKLQKGSRKGIVAHDFPVWNGNKKRNNARFCIIVQTYGEIFKAII